MAAGKKKVKVFPVWKTIKLGVNRTKEGYRRALKDAGCAMSNFLTCCILDINTVFSDVELEVDLVRVSVGDLDLKNGTAVHEVCEQALKFGLEFCPLEAIFALRLQYPDQPEGEWLLVVTDHGNENLITTGDVIKTNGVNFVGAKYTNRFFYTLDEKHRLVFVRPKPA
jgi:hypothetical protein